MLEVSTCTDLSLVMKCISSYFIGVKNSYKFSLCFLVSCQKELIGEFDNFTIVHDPLKFFFYNTCCMDLTLMFYINILSID